MALLTVSAMAQRQQRELSAADKIMMDQKNAFLAGMGDVMEKLEQYNKLYYQTSNRDSVSRLMEPYRKIYLERMTDYVKKYPSSALLLPRLPRSTVWLPAIPLPRLPRTTS